MKPILSRTWRRAVRAIGYSGTAALVLVGAAVAVALWKPLVDDELAQTQADMSDRTARLHARGPVSRPESSGEERLARYVDTFPLPTQMAADLGAVFASAERHQVTLLKGDYQLKAEHGSPFVTYVVTLPVHADYGPVKAFASNVLLDLPHASLDELRLRRDTAEADVLDAVVRFTLVYRNR